MECYKWSKSTSEEIGLEAELGFPVSEAYSLPTNAKSPVGSVMANPLPMEMVAASSQRVLIDKRSRYQSVYACLACRNTHTDC